MKTIFQRVGLAVAMAAAQAWTPMSLGAEATVPQRLKQAVTKIDVSIMPSTARRGQTVTWKLTVNLAPTWHTYPTRQKAEQDQSYVTKISFGEPMDAAPKPADIAPPDFIPVADFKEPIPRLEGELGYYEDSVTFERPLVVNPQTKPGAKIVKASLTLVVCYKKLTGEEACLPPADIPVEVPLTVSDLTPVAVDRQYADEVEKALHPPRPAKTHLPQPREKGTEAVNVVGDHKESLAGILSRLKHTETATTPSGLLGLVLTAVFWGAISLVTPCVFPMIPITVSFFLKQSEKEHYRPISMALVYCLTIVAVLTIAAVAFLSFFRWLSTDAVMNFALGLLFVFFALSLFGMYDIELPAGLARFTSAREGKGGLVGTVFMALTFTIVSFACVAPFLGAFGGTAAGSSYTWIERLIGGLAFATTFAAPFFVLAVFPAFLKNLPKSGSWLNSVKVVMGFLEMAAALNFFRTGELALTLRPSFFTFDLCLGMLVALSFLCGLYLLNVYRLPNDTPVESLSVPRLIFSMVFLGLGFYLMPALFKSGSNGEVQRPNGTIYAWVEAFLLPEARPGNLPWKGDLEQALDEARAQNQKPNGKKLVFVDFTGKTCKNCKWNEENVFSKGKVQKLLESYQLVQLYTDYVPGDLYPPSEVESLGDGLARQTRKDGLANLWFQRRAFHTEQLPLYVILRPLADGTVEVVDQYAEGKINNEDAFVRFLTKPLKQRSDTARAQAGYNR